VLKSLNAEPKKRLKKHNIHSRASVFVLQTLPVKRSLKNKSRLLQMLKQNANAVLHKVKQTQFLHVTKQKLKVNNLSWKQRLLVTNHLSQALVETLRLQQLY
jgi:hypothetical protein